MYRLLLPGLSIKRWILVNILGMILFAAGLSLTLWTHFAPRDWLSRIWNGFLQQALPTTASLLIGCVCLAAGLWLVSLGTRRLIGAFARAMDPTTTVRQLVMALLEGRRATPRVRIVGLGGGTGLSTLLRGLKHYPVDLTAIVTVSDDGGSSGRLRADLDMPPPGDIRNCLVALAEAEPLMEQLFQYRFDQDTQELHGHNLGNLIIAGLSEMTGDFKEAIRKASEVLAVRGRVLPSANRPLKLRAVMSDGAVVEGETAILAYRGVIAGLELIPVDVEPLPEALQALRDADVIILGPGSVYSSLLPNLLIPGMADALAESTAIKIFICNVMTQPGESDDFTAARHLEVVLQHLPCANPFHFAVVNTQYPSREVMAQYTANQQTYVDPDFARIRELGVTPVPAQLLAETLLARHDPEKLARCILETIAESVNVREKGQA